MYKFNPIVSINQWGVFMKHSRTVSLISLIISLFLLQPVFSQAPANENITITTYYPAPFGAYQTTTDDARAWGWHINWVALGN
jgi:hypothetical protein